MKKTTVNLIPESINSSPDYYCTWQTQLYATCDGKPENQRKIISETALFKEEKPFGWAYFYKEARKDLLLVMDDSWDVPLNGEPSYYGSLILNNEKFPEATNNVASNAEALKRLTQKIKYLGWKGLGGWVCAQESGKSGDYSSAEDYWVKKLKEADASGFAYWKVDWGNRQNDLEFRKMLTRLGKKYAPNLVIEHALINTVIPYSDVYRTYDVPAIMSIPMTMTKIADILLQRSPQKENMGLIDCEDEVYIAAAGGFTMGIMRHPYADEFTDGRADMSFPKVHRNLKTKMYEVLRAVHWHRIAPAFGVSVGSATISDNKLCDYWKFENTLEEIEEWWLTNPAIKNCMTNETVKITAPQQISRGCTLAKVQADENGNVPFTVSSKNPNGAFSVATLGRTMERRYEIPTCIVEIQTGNSDIIGAFGKYKELVINTDLKDIKSVLLQDLADVNAYDITSSITIENNRIIIPGKLIDELGTSAQPDGDTSEPAVVIRLVK